MALQFTMLSSPPLKTAHESDAFQTMFLPILVFSAAIAIAFSFLFGWIIKRLVSQPVLAEFGK